MSSLSGILRKLSFQVIYTTNVVSRDGQPIKMYPIIQGGKKIILNEKQLEKIKFTDYFFGFDVSGQLTKDELMKRIAIERSGECLSKEYTNSETKLEWKCSQGHTWMATPHSIKSKKSWCGVCKSNAKKNTIEDMQALAAKKNGKCLIDIKNQSAKINKSF